MPFFWLECMVRCCTMLVERVDRVRVMEEENIWDRLGTIKTKLKLNRYRIYTSCGVYRVKVHILLQSTHLPAFIS